MGTPAGRLGFQSQDKSPPLHTRTFLPDQWYDTLVLLSLNGSVMTNFTQMNIHIEPKWVDEIERLAETHRWSKARAIRIAIRTLTEVMSKHEEALRHPDDVTRPADEDVRDLYMAVAREIPSDLVEVVRSLDPRCVGGQPVIRAEGWLIWRDQATGDLIAREEAGEQRFGRLLNGKIEVMITPAAASQN